MLFAKSIGVLALAALPCSAQLMGDSPAPPAGVTEREISFKTVDGLTLPGTLTLPPARIGVKPPFVVLEQGSGVQDRDATMGENKFFQQLAYGMAARGAATLRYDRRAKVDPKNFKANADLEHEVVLDAAAALAFAQSLPEVDPTAVFYAGHSLGAELGPDVVALRLSQKPDSVRGMVLLSGIARPPDIIIHEQIQVLGAAQGGTPAQLAAMQQQWADVWTAARNPATPPNTPLGVGVQLPAAYWRDWLKRDPVATMHKLRIPMLVTRGSDDLNAPHADYDLLKSAATTPGSSAREFDGLNHIYMTNGSGAGMLQAGSIAPQFMDFVAVWILQTTGRK